MENELISKADAVSVLEEYAHDRVVSLYLESAEARGARSAAFECVRLIRNLPAFGKESRSKWITVHGYIQCPHCGTHGYKSWKRCPVCEMKMEG